MAPGAWWRCASVSDSRFSRAASRMMEEKLWHGSLKSWRRRLLFGSGIDHVVMWEIWRTSYGADGRLRIQRDSRPRKLLLPRHAVAFYHDWSFEGNINTSIQWLSGLVLSRFAKKQGQLGIRKIWGIRKTRLRDPASQAAALKPTVAVMVSVNLGA